MVEAAPVAAVVEGEEAEAVAAVAVAAAVVVVWAMTRVLLTNPEPPPLRYSSAALAAVYSFPKQFIYLQRIYYFRALSRMHLPNVP